MKFLSSIGSFASALFRRSRFEHDMDEELRAHLRDRARDLERSGLSRAEAERCARLDFGGYQKFKEECRESLGTHFVDTLVQDVRYALRTLRKSPGFTLVAVLTLALGIGANTAIFSLVDTALLHPLPFKNPSRLVMIGEGMPADGYPKIGISPEDFTVYEREQKSFESVGAFDDKYVGLSGGGQPERILAARVSASIFPMLGIQPLLGRTFTPQEDKLGKNVVILSYALWQRRYGASRRVIGKTVVLDRIPYTVIGVMPKRFQFPLRGPRTIVVSGNNEPANVWVPVAFTPEELQCNACYNSSALGRLNAGVTISQAQTEASLLARRIERQYPASVLQAFNNAQLYIWISPLDAEDVGSVRTMLLVLMAAVGMVLLIACSNVATLLLSRASARRREITIRSALGASPGRLARQVLTESIVLALGGGAIGILVARFGTAVLISLAPSNIPLPPDVPLGGSALLFAAAACCLTAIIFGIVPAIQSSAISPQFALQEGGRSGTPGRTRNRLQACFVVAEFALAFVLLIGAGLLLRSFFNRLMTNQGFRPDHVLTMEVPLPALAYPKATAIRGFYEQLAQRASNLPGVRSLGITTVLPLTNDNLTVMKVEGRPGYTPVIRDTWVLGNYFEAMGIPLLNGRYFTPQDRAGSQPVVVISEGTAKKYWPAGDAIGKRLYIYGTPDTATVVGIVGSVSGSQFVTATTPEVYVPYLQVPNVMLEDKRDASARSLALAVRTSTDPQAVALALVAQIHSLDSQLAVGKIRTMGQLVGSSVAGPRFNAFLFGLFACVALFLAALGIYGVLAYATVQRTHEIGIRMALGAQGTEVLRLVLGQGARLALFGLAIGLLIAVGLTRLMASLLFGVGSMDPLTFAVVAIVLVGIGMLACYIPARRATRVDPVSAMRCE
ncbi:MAG TPA: ABC transporter permease [Candidatus Acidoferrales bacterium]|nr:ABC transporter permease [Candidatus Acidoferrales bacterium]